MFFNHKDKQTDVYTPEREDKNKGRKKIAWIAFGVLIVLFAGWQFFQPDGTPGGSMMTRVDKTGQTAGADMYTPREQENITQTIVEEDGPIDPAGDSYFEGVQDTVNNGVQYITEQLGQSDNPAIDGVDTSDMLTRMEENPEGWASHFYSAPIVFEALQLFNFTQAEDMTDEERQSYEEQGTAVANPEEAYEIVDDSVTVEDATPEDSPYYVADITVQYKSEHSLPVTIQFSANISNKNRIFGITPISITAQQPGGGE